MTEIARSASPFAASVIPTTFSTALPAIATITSPVNAFETPSARTAGSSACDEPVGDERRADAGRSQQRNGTAERQVMRSDLERRLGRLARAQIAPEPRCVDAEQDDGTEDRDRKLVVARSIA